MLFKALWALCNMQAVSQVVMGSGWTINGKGEAVEIIIPPLILTQLRLGAVKGNGGTRRGGGEVGKNSEVIYTHSEVKEN